MIEEVFFNDPLLLLEDAKHSNNECRCFALGKTDEDLKLFVVFTKRENKIRVMSASMKNTKNIPSFKSEKEECEFWETHDSSEYLDWSQAKPVKFANLKKSTKTISLRLPADMLEALKVKANAMDIPYQSLIKMFLQKELTTS